MTALAAVCMTLAFPGPPCLHHHHHHEARGGQAHALTNVEIGEELARQHGWTGAAWRCLYALWNRESGWQTHDRNWSSEADGIPQANPASKMASAGADWRDDPAVQVRWGIGYIVSRYGSSCSALAHSDAYGYY